MQPWNRSSLTLVVLALLAATTACAANPGTDSTVARPPTATAPASANEHHGGGFALNTQAPPAPSTANSGSLPENVDLGRFNPPVTDQGAEAKCSASATDYYLRGWYAKRDGYYPASGFSPDFTYDQVPKQTDGTTMLPDHLLVQGTKGLDTIGDFRTSSDPTSLVTDADLTNAARYRIAGFDDHRNSFPSAAFVLYIKEQLASQTPLAIGIFTSPGFDNLSATSASDLVADMSSKSAGHALFAYGYDQRGLLVENEWGTGWGYNGYAVLSWAFVASFGQEVVSIIPKAPTAPAWQQLPGRASAISVGPNGSVWSLGVTPVPGGFGVYHWDPSNWTWNAIPGGAVRLAVDSEGNPWIVNSAGNILHWDGTAWRQLPGVAGDLALNLNDSLWIVSTITSSGTGCPQSGCGTSDPLTAGIGNSVAGPTLKCAPITCEGSIYNRVRGTWQQVPGKANRIAVDSNNHPWAVSASGMVSYYAPLPTCGLCVPTPTPGPGSWMTLPPPAAQALAIAQRDGTTQDEVWAIGLDGNLLRWNWDTNLWDVTQDVVPAIAIAASPSGNPWVVNTDGTIYELPAWDDM